MSRNDEGPRNDSEEPSTRATDPGLDPDDIHGSADATLGGYFEEHDRPPGFEGLDGHPYTVSVETERTPDLTAPIEGYLVFPRWASNGLGIVGHVESPTLWTGRSREEIEGLAAETPLLRVKAILDDAVRAREQIQDARD